MTEFQIYAILIGILLSALGLIINAISTFKNNKSRKLLNYQEITKSHREIWKITLDDPITYKRIYDKNDNLSIIPITNEEETFINLIFMHMTSTFNFSKHSDMIEIEKLKYDVDDFISFPIIKHFWEKHKQYFNHDFIQFIDNPIQSNSIFYNNLINFLKKFNITYKTKYLKNNLKDVLKHYIISFLLISIITLLINLIISFINGYNIFMPSKFIRIFGIILITTSAFGRVGWKIQTWDGDTFPELLNLWLFRILYFSGFILTIISLL